MFQRVVESVPFSTPWEQSFNRRLARLQAGEPRIAYYYDAPDGSTFRYRVYNMMQVLQTSRPEVACSWFCAADDLTKIPSLCDIIVLCRAKYSDRTAEMIERARGLGRTILFDVDDLVFDPSYVHLILRTLDQPLTSEEHWNFWFSTTARIGAAMALCDRFIVTTDALAERARALFGRGTTVVPNFLNREQLVISEKIFANKRDADFAGDGHIDIGYFSGSPSHNRDFAIVANALDTLLSRDRRVRLRIGGYLEKLGSVIRHMDRVRFYEMRDFVNLQCLLGSTQINIAPLQDNVFTNCKSNLKYFEAAAAGTLTVASPTSSFRAAIRHRENGWLSASFEWRQTLEEAIEALSDPGGRYADMAAQAFVHATTDYSLQNQLQKIESALFFSRASQPPRGNPDVRAIAPVA